jgi:hypothetical protein
MPMSSYQLSVLQQEAPPLLAGLVLSNPITQDWFNKHNN